MSRAYRITISETETRSLKGSDEVSTRLELLEILPPEAMADLLRGELAERGFEEKENGTLTRRDGAVVVTVDPCSGEVSVRSEVAEDVKLEVKRDATAFDDNGPGQSEVRTRAKELAKRDLDKKAEKESDRLQGEATAALEQALDDLQPELGKIVNKVTREALKAKAKQMGTVKSVTEDAESGDLTIRVEV